VFPICDPELLRPFGLLLPSRHDPRNASRDPICLQEYQPSRPDQGASRGATAAKRKRRTLNGGGGKSSKKAKKSNKAAAAAAALAAAEAASLEEEDEEAAKLARQQRVMTRTRFKHWVTIHLQLYRSHEYRPRWCLL